jgi:outer membrane murein-binding lipoprotein Lpp
MKKKYFMLAAAIIFAGILLMGCQTSTKKIDDVQVKVQ